MRFVVYTAYTSLAGSQGPSKLSGVQDECCHGNTGGQNSNKDMTMTLGLSSTGSNIQHNQELNTSRARLDSLQNPDIMDTSIQ